MCRLYRTYVSAVLATFAQLVHPQFSIYIIFTAYTILLYLHFCVIWLTQNLPRTPYPIRKTPYNHFYLNFTISLVGSLSLNYNYINLSHNICRLTHVHPTCLSFFINFLLLSGLVSILVFFDTFIISSLVIPH